MLNDILLAIIRTTIAFILLVSLSRLLGRKALSQMTYFDFTVVISFGSVAANLGIGQNPTFQSSVTALICFGLLGTLSGYLHIKSFIFRKLINSEPLVIMQNGDIVLSNMKKARMTLGELTSMLRDKNIFNVNEVHYAIIENNGTLSVLPKAVSKPLTPKDMQMSPADEGLTKDIIIDGKIMHENLNNTDKTEEWLINELRNRNIYKTEDVFFAALDSAGNLYVSKGITGKEKPGQHGIE